jgi:hypothetical protein
MQTISRTILALAVAQILSFGMAPSSHAASIITAVETGGDVVVTSAAGGSLDLTGLTLNGQSNRGAGIWPAGGLVAIGAGALTDDYIGAINGPSDFGAGGFIGAPPSVSGPYLGIENGFLAVPQGYVSGSILDVSSAAWVSQTFASLGMTPGTYVWTLASADTVTLNVGAPVPIPAAAWLFGSALGLLAWMRRKAT